MVIGYCLLSDEHHLLDGSEVTGSHPVEIHSGGYVVTVIVFTVPNEEVVSGFVMIACMSADKLTFGVEHINGSQTGIFHRILDSRVR